MSSHWVYRPTLGAFGKLKVCGKLWQFSYIDGSVRLNPHFELSLPLTFKWISGEQHEAVFRQTFWVRLHLREIIWLGFQLLQPDTACTASQ